MIHIHNDIESLKYFSDKNGISSYSNRAIAYAMQDENIVGIFYTNKQAEDFYLFNKYKKNLPVIGYWDENRWNFYHKNLKIK